jgi:hypothetical protein
MKRAVLSAVLSTLLSVWASSASGVSAAKVGDKGQGWEVVERKTEYGYKQILCKYDGKFKIQGSYREWPTANGDRPCPSPRPYIKRTGGKTVSLGQGKKNTVWRIKTSRNGTSTIRSATNRKYLTPLTDVGTADYDTDVVMDLDKKTWRYTIMDQDLEGWEGQSDEIDCLKNVNLLSESYTYISYSCLANEFRYDSEESDSWNLIPVV